MKNERVKKIEMSGEERHQVTLQSDDEMKIKGKKGRKKSKKHVE